MVSFNLSMFSCIDLKRKFPRDSLGKVFRTRQINNNIREKKLFYETCLTFPRFFPIQVLLQELFRSFGNYSAVISNFSRTVVEFLLFYLSLSNYLDYVDICD